MGKVYQLLVIEDDEDVRDLLRSSLSEYTLLDLEIHAFANAEDGFSSCANNAYDLVITDFKLPGMNGMEFIKEFRKISNRPVPIIFLSGYFKDLDVSRNAKHFDDVMFLEKPFDVEKLFTRVAVLLLLDTIKIKSVQELQAKIK